MKAGELFVAFLRYRKMSDEKLIEISTINLKIFGWVVRPSSYYGRNLESHTRLKLGYRSKLSGKSIYLNPKRLTMRISMLQNRIKYTNPAVGNFMTWPSDSRKDDYYINCIASF